MPDQELRALLDEIIRAGLEQGKTQGQIVRDAGVGQVTLSRAKRTGDIRFSTLTRLARAVGLRLALVPDTLLASRIERGDLFR